MSKRLYILKKSLVKKESVLDDKFSTHFDDVKSANGQPLNDKRNGHSTLNRWEKQSDSIRNQYKEIDKTKNAIDREEAKISETEHWYHLMPDYIKSLIDSGTLKQWRKHPRIMFVDGVEKARIYFDEETGLCSHKYVKSITDKEQYAVFRDLYNNINLKQKEAA